MDKCSHRDFAYLWVFKRKNIHTKVFISIIWANNPLENGRKQPKSSPIRINKSTLNFSKSV